MFSKKEKLPEYSAKQRQQQRKKKKNIATPRTFKRGKLEPFY